MVNLIARPSKQSSGASCEMTYCEPRSPTRRRSARPAAGAGTLAPVSSPGLQSISASLPSIRRQRHPMRSSLSGFTPKIGPRSSKPSTEPSTKEAGFTMSIESFCPTDRSSTCKLWDGPISRSPRTSNSAARSWTSPSADTPRRGVVLRTDLSADDRPVFGDRVQLQQVLLNLITNGVDAMSTVTDRPKVLAITSEPIEAGGMLVAVEDTGTGLDPATADRIFDPFFTTKPSGMGMGFSICRSLIAAHGGPFPGSPKWAV